MGAYVQNTVWIELKRIYHQLDVMEVRARVQTLPDTRRKASGDVYDDPNVGWEHREHGRPEAAGPGLGVYHRHCA